MVRRLPEYRERPKVFAFWLFVSFMIIASFPYFERIRNANEVPRVVQAMALWDAGHFAVDGPAGRRVQLGPDLARSPTNGRLYPNKPPGAGVVGAFGYGAARAWFGVDLDLREATWWVRFSTGMLPTMVLVWFLLRTLHRDYGRAAATAAVALYALGTPAYAYSHLAYGHQLAACLLYVGMWLCIRVATTDGGTQRSGSLVRAAVGGLLAGAAVTVEYSTALAGLPLGIALLRAARRRGSSAPLASVAGALVPIVALSLYHVEVFGAPWSTGYHYATTPEFAAKHAIGVLGGSWPTWHAFYTHVVAIESGLLGWAPLWVLGIYGLGVASQYPDECGRVHARVLLATLLLAILAGSGLQFDGGWRVGPRYLVAFLPMLATGWGEVLAEIQNRVTWIVVVVALGTYSVILNVWTGNLWPHFDLANVHHPAPEVLLPLWLEGVEPYGILRLLLRYDGVHAIIAIGVCGAVLALVRIIEPMPRTILAAATGTWFGIVLAGSLLFWPRHPRGAANLRYILAVWEPRIDSPNPPPSHPLRPLTADDVRRAREGPRETSE